MSAANGRDVRGRFGMLVDGVSGFSTNDRALLAEAVRRVQGARFRNTDDPAVVTQAVAAAMLQGRRHLFGLVKVGCNAA